MGHWNVPMYFVPDPFSLPLPASQPPQSEQLSSYHDVLPEMSQAQGNEAKHPWPESFETMNHNQSSFLLN
jgi:hypothetical protein